MTDEPQAGRSIGAAGATVKNVVLALGVTGVIAVLVGLGVAAVSKIRQAAARTQVICDLKQVALGTHGALDTWQQLPPASGPYGKVTGNYSLSVHLLPFIEQQTLYQIALDGNAMPTTELIPPYRASLDPSTSDWIRVQNFACNLRVFTDAGARAYDPKTGYTDFDETTISGVNTGTLEKRMTDGTSNTMMYTTRYAAHGTNLAVNGSGNCSNYDVLAGTADAGQGAYFGGIVATGLPDSTPKTPGGWQVNPIMADANCDPGLLGKGPGSLAMSFGGAGGLQVAMGDGSVHQVSTTVSAAMWNAALQPNDAVPLGSDW